MYVCSGPLAHYRTLVDQGKLQHDPYQENVAFELENLLKNLEQYEKDMEEYHVGWNSEQMFVMILDKT